MQEGLLPLFPLQVVLFPGAELPLHIFEDRYKEMIAEALEQRHEFGVVLANEKGVVNTGCTAKIDRVLKHYDDGRLDIMTLGRRRFEILLLNNERSFLRGAVEFFDDDHADPASAEIQQKAIAGYNELQALTAQKPMETGGVMDPHLSFKLAEVVPDLSFRQLLLSTRSEAERMRRLADYIPTYLVAQKRIQRLKDVAPTNGHGRGGHISS